MKRVILIMVLCSCLTSFAQSEESTNHPETKTALKSKVEKTNNTEMVIRSKMYIGNSSANTESIKDTTSINENSRFKISNNNINTLKKEDIND